MTPQQELTYPWGDTLPEAGYALTIADGVRWIRMPLPYPVDHINLWLLRDQIDGREGWTVVDCGWARTPVKETWEQLFVNALDGLPILRVIVTHMHPDHIGLAHWLCERWGASLWMSMTEYFSACFWSQPYQSGADTSGPATVQFFARHGLCDPEAQEYISQRGDYFPALVPSLPSSFVRLVHGDHITIAGRDWRVIVGYGHSPEHVSLYCETQKILIAGDMLLPRISTNVSVYNYEPEGNPLSRYLKSLDEYNGLAKDTLVLPSHGQPFRGMYERIDQQRARHTKRLQEALEACAEPMSTFDILPVLFKRELPHNQLTFAMGEALAYLHALYFEGKLERSIDDEGVVRFKRMK